MDVDALTAKVGLGKDGKGGKGHKHGSPEANGKANKDKFAGECWTCGKAGHTSIECWHKDKNLNLKERTVERERKEEKQLGRSGTTPTTS
eukprot:2902912-Amphidinium_carterae.1